MLQSLSPHLVEAREILSNRIIQTPHDFIRRPESFCAVDKRLYIEALTRELPETDDLRCLYETRGSRLAIFAERLPWDSSFFGYDVIRLNGIFNLDQITVDIKQALHSFLDILIQRNVRYVFGAVPVEELMTIQGLCSAGFTLIETRLTYHRSLTDYSYIQRFPVRAALPSDVPALSETARLMVNRYDRFHADPFISAEKADQLMAKWIEASINDKFADITIVPDVDSPKAFCTVKYHADKWEQWGLKLAQPVFSAVGPEFRGWYLKLISEINYHLKGIGAQHCFLITQLTNRAVIHIWETLGFKYGHGEHVFRAIL